MSAREHASRRADAAAAAAASDIVPINSKRAPKRPITRPKASISPLAPLTAVKEVPNFVAVDEPTSGIETLEAGGGEPSRVPAKPPGSLPRDENGQLPLLQHRAGIDADEVFGSQENALSSYLKLHPVLSLESTSFQTLQLVANLVEETSIPTRELEIVPKSHDDGYLRCELPRLNPPRPGSSVPLARACAGRPTSRSASVLAASATGASACGSRAGAMETTATWPS